MFNYYFHFFKIIIIGICAILRSDNIALPSREIYSNYLNFLLVLLNNQKISESKKLKTIHKDELEVGFGSDSDYEEDEEDDAVNEDDLIYKCVDKLLKTKKFYAGEFNKEEHIFEVCYLLHKIMRFA